MTRPPSFAGDRNDPDRPVGSPILFLVLGTLAALLFVGCVAGVAALLYLLT